MRTSEATEKLDAALAAAQAELANPTKDKSAKMKGKSKAGNEYEISYNYADIANVLNDVRPVLSKHKIALTQSTAVIGGALLLVTRLSHGGQWIEGDYPVCQINGDHQEMGKAMTYARRYALTAMIGVAAEDDTDGQGASHAHAPAKPALRTEPKPPTLSDRADRLETTLKAVGTAADLKKAYALASGLCAELDAKDPERLAVVEALYGDRLNELEVRVAA